MSGLHLEILALANYADFSKDSKLSITGIFDQIYSVDFPTALLRGFIALTVAGAEPNKNLLLNLEILDPSNKQIGNNPPISLNIGSNGRGNFTLELVGMPLSVAGIYTILIKFGKKELGSTKFEVIKLTAENGRSTKTGRSVN